MNKTGTYIITGIVIVLLAVVAVYTFSGKNLKEYTTSVVGLYLDEQYEEALVTITEAKRKGHYDTNLGIIHGQILAKLERYEEARIQYELVKAEDASAIAAVDELLAELP